MIIVNEATLQLFREAKCCELCGKPTPGGADVHHLIAKGSGGGRRMDVAINLIALDRSCHQNLHAGAVAADLRRIVAKREGVKRDDIQTVLWLLQRLPKDATTTTIEKEMKNFNETERALAIKTLKEAGIL